MRVTTISPVEVISSKERSFKGSAGNEVKYVETVLYTGTEILKMSTDKDLGTLKERVVGVATIDVTIPETSGGKAKFKLVAFDETNIE